MEAWVSGLIGVALGCAGSTAGTAINNYHQARRDRRNKRLELSRVKIEEAYQLLVQIDSLFLQIYANRNMLSGLQEDVFYKPEKDLQEFLKRHYTDADKAIEDKVEELYASLKMLAALYLPVLNHFLRVSDAHRTAWLIASGDEHMFWLDVFQTRPRSLTEDEANELENLRDVLIEEGHQFSSTCGEMKQYLSDLMAKFRKIFI